MAQEAQHSPNTEYMQILHYFSIAVTDLLLWPGTGGYATMHASLSSRQQRG